MKCPSGVVCAAVVMVAVSTATLAGCGADNPYELPEYQSGGPADGGAAPGARSPAGPAGPTPGRGSGAASPAPSSALSETEPIPSVPREASPASTAVTYSPADAMGEGAWVERGTIRARNAQAKAAVAAVVGYLGQRVQISNTWTVDEAALAAVASGQARTSAQERAAQQQAAGRRSVGRFVVNVSSVKVQGDTATVTGCHFDSTSELDAHGYVLVPPPGGLLITMEVHSEQGVWHVTSWPTKKVPTCSGWKK